MNDIMRCKNCDWSGSHDQLDSDKIDTCLGNDTIEMCPSCGSYEIVEIREIDEIPGVS